MAACEVSVAFHRPGHHGKYSLLLSKLGKIRRRTGQRKMTMQDGPAMLSTPKTSMPPHWSMMLQPLLSYWLPKMEIFDEQSVSSDVVNIIYANHVGKCCWVFLQRVYTFSAMRLHVHL